MNKSLLLIPVFVLMSAFTQLSAQTQSAAADTSQYPYWIAMMQDPDANFFQVQSTFNK